MITKSDLQTMFSPHFLDTEQIETVDNLRAKALEFAILILENVPAGPNQTLAIRHIEDALMRANKGISEGL